MLGLLCALTNRCFHRNNYAITRARLDLVFLLSSILDFWFSFICARSLACQYDCIKQKKKRIHHGAGPSDDSISYLFYDRRKLHVNHNQNQIVIKTNAKRPSRWVAERHGTNKKRRQKKTKSKTCARWVEFNAKRTPTIKGNKIHVSYEIRRKHNKCEELKTSSECKAYVRSWRQQFTAVVRVSLPGGSFLFLFCFYWLSVASSACLISLLLI